jgi:hypothetical protein
VRPNSVADERLGAAEIWKQALMLKCNNWLLMRTFNTKDGGDTARVRNTKSVLEARYVCKLYTQHNATGSWSLMGASAKHSEGNYSYNLDVIFILRCAEMCRFIYWATDNTLREPKIPIFRMKLYYRV